MALCIKHRLKGFIQMTHQVVQVVLQIRALLVLVVLVSVSQVHALEIRVY